MTEEKLTKIILAWLEENGWEIVAFDFPQSGTGTMLHPEIVDRSHKNSDTIIPDIIALKNGVTAIFENKNRFVAADFEKTNLAKSSGLYESSLAKILKDIAFENTFWGIGMLFSEKNLKRTDVLLNKVDFVFFVEENGAAKIIGKQSEIFTRP